MRCNKKQWNNWIHLHSWAMKQFVIRYKCISLKRGLPQWQLLFSEVDINIFIALILWIIHKSRENVSDLYSRPQSRQHSFLDTAHTPRCSLCVQMDSSTHTHVCGAETSLHSSYSVLHSSHRTYNQMHSSYTPGLQGILWTHNSGIHTI